MNAKHKFDIRIQGRGTTVYLHPAVWQAFQAMAKASGNTLSAEAALAQRGHNGSLAEAIEKHVGEVPLHATREVWLGVLVDAMRPEFAKRGYPLPAKIRASIAFTSKGWRGKRRGECWSPTAVADKATEIMVCLRERDPVRILNILTHELVHAAQFLEAANEGKPVKNGHDRRFKKIAAAMDVTVGKGTHALGDPDGAWGAWAKPLLDLAGPMPHHAIAEFVAKEKKQTTRMLKLECAEDEGGCGAVWRMSSGHIADKTHLTCPCCAARVLNPHFAGGDEDEALEDDGGLDSREMETLRPRGKRPVEGRTPKATVDQVDRTLKAIGKAVKARVRDRVTERDWRR